jgi:hypothetical protein
MAIDMQDVKAILEPDEPDYAAAATLGVEALPYLQVLVHGDDPMIAAKAVYAASLLEGSLGLDVVRAGMQHSNPAVRVAAAAATKNLPATEASEVLVELVSDNDPGVRKVAMSSVPDEASQALVERLTTMPESDPGEGLGEGIQLPDLSMLSKPMPGEQGSSGLMPGEQGSSGLMPGEQGNSGLMPGEQGSSGLMPGGRPPT